MVLQQNGRKLKDLGYKFDYVQKHSYVEDIESEISDSDAEETDKDNSESEDWHWVTWQASKLFFNRKSLLSRPD